jgi:hypothetical protein
MPRDRDEDEDEDDRPRRRKRDDEDDEDDDRPRRKRSSGAGGIENVIPFRNGMALASYYCGVFGLISCFLGLGFFGIVPIILGVLGLKRAAADSEARGRVHAWVGIGLGTLEVLSGCAIVGFIGYGIMQGGRR